MQSMKQVALLVAFLAETAIEAVSGVQPEAATASLAEAEPETVPPAEAEAAVASPAETEAETAVAVGIASEVEPLAATLK